MKPYDLPDERGHFGPYGGIFVAETLMHALADLNEAYAKYRKDPEFIAEYQSELTHFVAGRAPSTTPAAGASCSAARRSS